MDQLVATADRLAGALAGHHAGVTEVSDHLTIIRRWLAGALGPHKGCALDCTPASSSRGIAPDLERAGIALLQRDLAPTYRRGTAQLRGSYLWAWLVDAGQRSASFSRLS